MKKRSLALIMTFVLVLMPLALTGCGGQSSDKGAQNGPKPIVIGVPTSLGSIEGADLLQTVRGAGYRLTAIA